MGTPQGNNGAWWNYVVPAILMALIATMMALIVVLAQGATVEGAAFLLFALLLGVVVLFVFALAALLGLWLMRRFDDPVEQSSQPGAGSSQPGEQSSDLLFALVFSTLVFSVLSFLSLSFLQDHLDLQDHWASVLCLFGLISFISGFLPPCMKGMLNNLRNEMYS
jgi:small-conductance mechanosensitive channel